MMAEVTARSDVQTWYEWMESPLGRILLTCQSEGLSALLFEAGRHARGPEPGWKRGASLLREAAVQIDAYLKGERRVFDLPLAPRGTEFQRRVWQELERIPYAHTCAYGDIARSMGKSNATRAVGAANGKNPISIIVPCHRVVGANGKLTGYGGGLRAKMWLLTLERRGRAAADASTAAGATSTAAAPS